MENLTNRIKQKFAALQAKKASQSETTSLYQLLYTCIKEGIANKDIPEGVNLPATRILADALHVSRVTVNRGYELLCLEGHVTAVKGSGYLVKNRQHSATLVPAEHELNPNHYPEISEAGQSFLRNVSLINSTDDESIAFRPGLPPLDIFPVNQWKNLMNLYWRHIKSSALTYSPASGIEPLKRNLANYLNLNRGIKCDPRQIIIVSGSLQSLYLVGNVLLNPGDKVVMENPTFPNVYSIFKGLRAQIESTPVDANGMCVDDLVAERYSGSKLLHCTPACHYPNSVQLSLPRRKALLAWAARNKTFIIENDYEHEVYNPTVPLPSIYSLDDHARTIYMSTFNRILHPSIRLGYMVVPYYLLDAVEAHIKHSHRFVPPSIQMVLNQFLEKKYLHHHIQKVVEVATEREQIFREHFEEAFGRNIVLQKNNIRSLHVLAKLPPNENDRALVKALAQNNIVVHSYSKCFNTPEKEQGLIMGYSSVRPPIIKKKIAKMAEIYAQYLKLNSGLKHV